MGEVVMKPNIQEYHDYLEFLKDWTEFLKEREKGFSLRKIAKEAGIASGYLPMCFSRKRKFSVKAYEKVKPFLKLSAKEERYLDLLRVIAESENPKERVQALTDLQKLKDYKNTNRLELEVHQYLSRWYYVAIREMIGMPEFNGNPEWIQDRLRGRISQKEVEEALSFLLKYDFVQKSSEGKYSVKDKQLNCNEGVFKLSLGEFHRQMLDWAKTSIEETSRDERLLLGHTALLNREQYQRIQEILKESLNTIESVENKQQQANAEVYHIELALFPLTKRNEK